MVSFRSAYSRVLVVVTVVGSLVAATPEIAGAEDTDDASFGDVHGQTYDTDPSDDPWVDPVVLFDLDPAALEATPVPDLDELALLRSDVLADDVVRIAVEDDPLPEAVERHRSALHAAAVLRVEVAALSDEIRDRLPDLARLADEIETHRNTEARLLDENALLRNAITEFAIQTFIGGEAESTMGLDLTENASTDALRILDKEVRDEHLARIEENEDQHARTVRQRISTESDLAERREAIDALRAERLNRWADIRAADDLVAQTRADHQRVLHSRLDAFVVGSDIPLVALNAYVIAERVLADERPDCGVEWWMLAGIGRIESLHGHFAESTLDIHGTTTDPIFGPALDGRILSGGDELPDGVDAPDPTGRSEDQTVTVPAESAPPAAVASVDESTGEQTAGSDEAAPGDAETGEAVAEVVVRRLALILDTDGGELDADTVYDRAVGPMQFIPQTWRGWATDTDRDGDANPQNIYDATVAAGRYLCAASSLGSADGQERAFFAYNHDDEYTRLVSTAATVYQSQIVLTDRDDAEEQPTKTRHLGIAEDPEDDVPDLQLDALSEWLGSNTFGS